MPKNAYILEKSCKIAAVLGSSSPNTRWPSVNEDYAPRPQKCYSHLLM